MISIFKSVEESVKPINKLTVNEVLQLIKDHPQKDRIIEARTSENGGKYNENLIYDAWSKERGKYKRNLYNHVKSKEVLTVTWNCLIKDTRSIANVEETSGYIYADVDDFAPLLSDKILNVEQAREYTWNLLTNNAFSFIKSVWRSFGGDGFGFLIKVDGITKNNFHSTWKSLEHLFAGRKIKFDPVTKDISRANVLSYDPNIFIRDDEDVKPFIAVEASQKNIKTVKVNPLTFEMSKDVMQNQLDWLYNDDEFWTENKTRLTYKFFISFFGFLNSRGIELENALAFLQDKASEYPCLFNYRNFSEIDVIATKIYNNYSSQFETVQIGIPIDTKLENEYEVEEVYKTYQGDIQVKLHHIWHNLENKNYDNNKKLTVYSTIVKNTGILKEEIIDFLCSIDFVPNDSEMELIHNVYINPNIHFGIVKIQTQDAIDESKRLFFADALKNTKKIVTRTKYEGNTSKKLESILKECQNVYNQINNNNIFKFLTRYFKETKSFAISCGEAFEYIKGYYDKSDDDIESMKKSGMSNTLVNTILRLNKQIIRYAKYLGKEVYSYEEWKYGLQIIQCLSPEMVKARYNITQEYYLDSNQHISDLSLEVKDNTIIWGNTNQGKTTWICEHIQGKRLVLVPIIPLLKGIQNSHNASVFYKYKKDVREGDDLIVCTYSSFPTLLKIMEKWKNVKVSEYQLFFDEYHNNATSSDHQFRGYELNFIADNMHLFKSRTMLTGTMFPILHPKFEKFDIIRVNWKNVPPKKFKRTIYNNLMYSIENQLSKDGLNVIYLQNKKEEGKLGSFIDYLEMKGWDKDRIWCINADEKTSEHFQKLVNNCYVDDDIQILICTSVISEGANIYNTNVKTIHFMTPEGVINSEQMVNRFRHVYNQEDPDCMIYLYKKMDDEPVDETDQLDVVQMQQQLSGLAQSQLDYFAISYISGGTVTHNMAQKLFVQNMFRNSGFFRNNNGRWEVDYLSIANIAFNEERKYSAKDIEFTKMMLSEYNWQFYGDNYVLEDITEKEKSTISELKEVRKEDLLKDSLEIIENIKSDGEEITIDKISEANVEKLEQTERPSLEISLRSKVKWLCNNMDFKDSCSLVEDWVNEHGMSDRIWSKIMRQVNVKIAKEMNIFAKGYVVTTEFAKSLMDYYKKSKINTKGEPNLMTLQQMQRIVKNRAKLTPSLDGVEITEHIALDVMSKYFDIDKKIDGNLVKYQLIGINISNDIATFSNDLEDWAKKCFNENVTMTSDELATTMNLMRSKLPLLSMYKLNSNTAMKLIHDYFGFERVSSRKINGKKVNVYGFTSLFPKEISNVTVRPMRKVELADKHEEDMTYDEKILFNHQTKLDSIYHQMELKESEVLDEMPF